MPCKLCVRDDCVRVGSPLQTHVVVAVDVHPRLCFCGDPYYHSRVLVARTRGLCL